MLSARARSMAARCASASSTAVNSLRRNPSCAAAIVSAVRSVMRAPSLDHLGDDEIVTLARRRILEDRFRVAAVGDDVGALLHDHGHHRGHRLDAGHVDFGELLDERQNRVELALQMLDLAVRDRDAREMRDVANGLGIDRHGRSYDTVTALPFSGTITLVACPFISATKASAVGAMMGNEP